MSWQPSGSVTAIALVVTVSMVSLFANRFLDLLVSVLCVAYTTMVLFTIAGNLSFVQRGRFSREAAQIVAVIAASESSASTSSASSPPSSRDAASRGR